MTDAPPTRTLPVSASWPSEPASGRGRSHGTSSTKAFDRWFRYPAGFASDYVDLLLENLSLSGGTVLDCFAGSGVTGTAARARNLNFFGIEAHPEIAELARLKLAPSSRGSVVRAAAARAVDASHLLAINTPVDGETDLVLRSFSPETLTALSRLRAVIQDAVSAERAEALYLKWALLGTLRDVAGVKVGWPYQRPGLARKPRYADVYARFLARAEMVASDLDGLGETDIKSTMVDPDRMTSRRGRADVVTGDSRDPASWQTLSEPAEACIASPPYLNNFDYADATRLELYFWGTVTTWREMCTDVRGQMVTATTQQSSVGEMRAAQEALRSEFPLTAKQIEDLVDEVVGVKTSRERRSKEYDQVLPAYFLSMAQILQNLHRNLVTGGDALWLIGDSAPYGVYVDTPGIIGALATEVGFKVTADVPLRVRGNRWGSNPDRHQVPLTERLLVLRQEH